MLLAVAFLSIIPAGNLLLPLFIKGQLSKLNQYRHFRNMPAIAHILYPSGVAI